MEYWGINMSFRTQMRVADGRVCFIRLKGVEPKEVYEKLQGKFGDNVFSRFQMVNGLCVGVLISEKYNFIRINSDVAAMLLILGKNENTEICVTTAGGKTGLIRYDWGMHSKLLKEIEKTIRQTFPEEIIEHEVIVTPVAKPIKELYEKMLNRYILAYGTGIGEHRLEKKINSYVEQGLSREEAIQEVAKDEGDM